MNRKRRYVYPGDFTSPDMDCPEKARRCLSVMRIAIEKKDKQLQITRKTINKLREEILTMNELLEHLKDENLITKKTKEEFLVKN